MCVCWYEQKQREQRSFVYVYARLTGFDFYARMSNEQAKVGGFRMVSFRVWYFNTQFM